MNIKHSFLAVAILGALAIGSGITACFHDSNASGSSSPIRLLAVSIGKSAAASAYDVATSVQSGGSGGSGGGTSPKPQQVSAVSAGTILGTVMNTDPYNSPTLAIQTDTGVMFQADANTGDVQTPPDLYYESLDCTGQALVIVGDSSGASVPAMVFRNGGAAFTLSDGSVGMVLKVDAQGAPTAQVSANANRVLTGGNCNPIGLSGSFFYQVQPNDPAKTHLAGANVGQIGFTGQ